MICAAIEGGTADRRAIFEMFARQLPPGRRYGVVAGTGRFLDALANFRFSPADLDFLRGHGVIDVPTADYLASYRFGGNIWGYAEGDCYFPGSPILVVDGTFAETVILETLALSVFNHDCAVASAASRMVSAAGHRPVIEMGSRRTHELAAVAAARAAYLAGFNTSSNLRAGQEYGVPTAGTSAHAFTMVHDNERQAFAVQLESLGVGTTLLVDTYDVPAAVKTAVELAGSALGAVRIDSGDVAEVAAGRTRSARRARGEAHQDRGDRRPGRVLDRRPGHRAGRRLRGRHQAGHRVWRSDRVAGLQAGRPLRRVSLRSAGRAGRPGREAIGRQADDGRTQVGDAQPGLATASRSARR